MHFTKMHGIGNDYVYINGFVERVEQPEKLAPIIADRHFGVGGDGLILILPSDRADVRMRMFNADGSEGEMCGNGIRCVAKYAWDHGLTKNNPMTVETGRGVLTLDLHLRGGKVEQVAVKMGEPILELAQIPVKMAMGLRNALIKKRSDHEYELALAEPGKPHIATFVSMGNPHAVMYVDNVQAIDLPRLGPLLEHYGAFPRRINAHWVQVQSPDEVMMRTWERGSGITLACGTGACAVCVAGVLTGRTSRKLLAHLPGGDLRLEWRDSDNNVYMTGPATEVFTGDWPG
jgi:diaminopimelate epimerase